MIRECIRSLERRQFDGPINLLTLRYNRRMKSDRYA